LFEADDFQSRAEAVGHGARSTASTSVKPSWCALSGFVRIAERFRPDLASLTVVVAHDDSSSTTFRDESVLPAAL
jgi:hypothetical protein